MTGTGTKADPYIVFTWDDLTTAIVQNDVYIELGGDIDGKALGDINIQSKYTMNFKELDGKEHSIKNFTFTGHDVFEGVKSNTIKNLKFKRVTTKGNVALFVFDATSDTYYTLPTFVNCDFSAACVNSGSLINIWTTLGYTAVFRKCSFYTYLNDGWFTDVSELSYDRYPIILDECTVELRGTAHDGTFFSAQLINTHVFGEVTVDYASDPSYHHIIRVQNAGCYAYYTTEFMKANSIIDLVVNNNTGNDLYLYVDGKSYTDDNDDTHYVVESLFVNVTFLQNVTFTSTLASATVKQCTSAQITSEDYLRTNGFVAETLINDRYLTKESLTCERYATGGAYIDTGLTNVRYRKTLVQWEYSSIDVERWVAGGVRVNYGGVMHGSQDGIALYDGTYGDNSMNIRSNFSYGIVGTKLESMSTGGGSDSYQTDYNFIINGRNLDGTAMRGIGGKIYSVKIWETDSTPLRNYIPVYDTTEHKYGMYDTVNNTFYGSASDVQFPGAEPLPFKFENGKLHHIKMEALLRLGAFINCTHLTEVRIPDSVTSIGPYSFYNTGLRKVRIPSGCTYCDTSFPEDCEIEFYE